MTEVAQHFTVGDESGRRTPSALAALLNCITEEEMVSLANIKPSTAEAWRKRGTGPTYLLFGNRFLYPVHALTTYLEGLAREPRSESNLL